jgi:hypothetical protein
MKGVCDMPVLLIGSYLLCIFEPSWLTITEPS